jgi:hypothetical protein
MNDFQSKREEKAARFRELAQKHENISTGRHFAVRQQREKLLEKIERLKRRQDMMKWANELICEEDREVSRISVFQTTRSPNSSTQISPAGAAFRFPRSKGMSPTSDGSKGGWPIFKRHRATKPSNQDLSHEHGP